MWYIKSIPENGNHGNPYSKPFDGAVILPDELLNSYIESKGFVNITVEAGEVTALSRNEEAYNAYEAEHPIIPDPPTDLERVEAQALYTALMTDTLLEE